MLNRMNYPATSCMMPVATQQKHASELVCKFTLGLSKLQCQHKLKGRMLLRKSPEWQKNPQKRSLAIVKVREDDPPFSEEGLARRFDHSNIMVSV